MATGTESYLNNPGFADLKKGSEKWFVQESVDPGTLGSEVVQGEFAIDDGLVASDTSPVFTDYSQPNNPEVPEVETATTVKTIRGANYDVIKSKKRALSNITFIPGTACAMSEAIAYIRYWSRKGTQQKKPAGQDPQNGTPTDAQKALQGDIKEKYFSSVDESLANPEFGSGEVTGSETRVVAKVPENTAYQSRPRQPVPVRVQAVSRANTPVSGSIYSANPSGSVATVPSALPAEAVWTFLFNPEELQLSSGPDYNRAETWGVSDPTNSGQPLSWRSNKNQKLTFSKVLLHGYSFGKRVDSLERGLQELFTARDGENGSDGPPVLEFVWGKREFGPCVIQNIQVREKAWDKGLLVNAEVSFELEQVPEWTINDGFVDVLRPGRQPTVNDELLPASTREAGADPGDDDDDDDENKPDGGKPPVPGNPLFCNAALKYKDTLQQEFDKTGIILRRAALFDPGLNMEAQEKYFSERYLDSFSQRSSSNNNSSTNKDYVNFTFNYVDTRAPGCTRERYASTKQDILGSNPGRGERIRSVRFINGCLKLLSEARNEWIKKESKSGGVCAPLVSSRQAAQKTTQANQKCEKYRTVVSPSSGKAEPSKCSANQAGTRITCGNVSYYCERSSAKGNDWVWSPRT